jgi:hypothetical protein
MGKGLEETFLKRRFISSQWVQKKVFALTNYQGNANEHHCEISPYTC